MSSNTLESRMSNENLMQAEQTNKQVLPSPNVAWWAARGGVKAQQLSYRIVPFEGKKNKNEMKEKINI